MKLRAFMLLSVMLWFWLSVALLYGDDSKKQEDWNSINAAVDKGFALLSREGITSDPVKRAGVRMDRVRAFLEAERSIAQWRDKYVSDKRSLAFLEVTFRLGLFAEYAESFLTAHDMFLQCLEHEQIRNRDAVYNRQLIEVLANNHLARIKTLFSEVRQNGQEPWDVREFSIAQSVEPREQALRNYLEDHANRYGRFLDVASAEDAATAARELRAPQSIDDAMRANLEMLRSSQLPIVTATTGNIGLLGIGGTKQELDAIARDMNQFIDRLRYDFDITDNSRITSIFINLAKEREWETAKKLSQALFGDSAADLGTYYDPIRDFLVVFKKSSSRNGSPLDREVYRRMAALTSPGVPDWIADAVALAYLASDVSQERSSLCLLDQALKQGTFPKMMDLTKAYKLKPGDPDVELLQAAEAYFAIFMEGGNGKENVLHSYYAAEHAGHSRDMPFETLQEPFQEFVTRRIDGLQCKAC